jgi:hypothetical protein
MGVVCVLYCVLNDIFHWVTLNSFVVSLFLILFQEMWPISVSGVGPYQCFVVVGLGVSGCLLFVVFSFLFHLSVLNTCEICLLSS